MHQKLVKTDLVYKGEKDWIIHKANVWKQDVQLGRPSGILHQHVQHLKPTSTVLAYLRFNKLQKWLHNQLSSSIILSDPPIMEKQKNMNCEWNHQKNSLSNKRAAVCVYIYKYQYIIFHCHPPIGLVATPICLNPSQANSTDAPSVILRRWMAVYIYIYIVCCLSLSVAAELMCLLYHQNPLQPPQVSSGVTRGHRWRSQWWPVEIPTNKNEVFNWLPFSYISPPGCHAWYMTI